MLVHEFEKHKFAESQVVPVLIPAHSRNISGLADTSWLHSLIHTAKGLIKCYDQETYNCYGTGNDFLLMRVIKTNLPPVQTSAMP